jgi:hypothetical protein
MFFQSNPHHVSATGTGKRTTGGGSGILLEGEAEDVVGLIQDGRRILRHTVGVKGTVSGDRFQF